MEQSAVGMVLTVLVLVNLTTKQICLPYHSWELVLLVP